MDWWCVERVLTMIMVAHGDRKYWIGISWIDGGSGGVGGRPKQGCSDDDSRDARAKKERCNSKLELISRAET